MCGRYNLVPTESIAARFDVQQEQLSLSPRYNVAPGQSMPVVVRKKANSIAEMQWGLVPSWSKELRTTFSTINARAETITKSPVFRGPFKGRRCLVPASGFYEWQATQQGKQPYCFQLHGGELFAFAGLYDIWRDAEGNARYTYTIITTAPNELVAPIHRRMPVILRPEEENIWLDPAAEPERLMSLLAPYAASRMEAFMVSRALNSPANEDADLIRPLAAA